MKLAEMITFWKLTDMVISEHVLSTSAGINKNIITIKQLRVRHSYKVATIIYQTSNNRVKLLHADISWDKLTNETFESILEANASLRSLARYFKC